MPPRPPIALFGPRPATSSAQSKKAIGILIGGVVIFAVVGVSRRRYRTHRGEQQPARENRVQKSKSRESESRAAKLRKKLGRARDKVIGIVRRGQ
ncbi:MAG: hypothetical protein Q9220_005194 [cf. Caloplaca sp. 1 TL-2023]